MVASGYVLYFILLDLCILRNAIKNAMPVVVDQDLAVVLSQIAVPGVTAVVVLIRVHTRVRALDLPIVDVGLVAALILVTAVTHSAIAVEIVIPIRITTINVEGFVFFVPFA